MRLKAVSGAAALIAAFIVSSCAQQPRGPVLSQILPPLFYRSADHTLHLRSCDGTLTAQEKATEVIVRYYEDDFGPGEASCGVRDLSVTLRAPLGSREVLDGATGRPVEVEDLAAPPSTAEHFAILQ